MSGLRPIQQPTSPEVKASGEAAVQPASQPAASPKDVFIPARSPTVEAADSSKGAASVPFFSVKIPELDDYFEKPATAPVIHSVQLDAAVGILEQADRLVDSGRVLDTYLHIGAGEAHAVVTLKEGQFEEAKFSDLDFKIKTYAIGLANVSEVVVTGCTLVRGDDGKIKVSEITYTGEWGLAPEFQKAAIGEAAPVLLKSLGLDDMIQMGLRAEQTAGVPASFGGRVADDGKPTATLVKPGALPAKPESKETTPPADVTAAPDLLNTLTEASNALGHFIESGKTQLQFQVDLGMRRIGDSGLLVEASGVKGDLHVDLVRLDDNSQAANMKTAVGIETLRLWPEAASKVEGDKLIIDPLNRTAGNFKVQASGLEIALRSTVSLNGAATADPSLAVSVPKDATDPALLLKARQIVLQDAGSDSKRKLHVLVEGITLSAEDFRKADGTPLNPQEVMQDMLGSGAHSKGGTQLVRPRLTIARVVVQAETNGDMVETELRDLNLNLGDEHDRLQTDLSLGDLLREKISEIAEKGLPGHEADLSLHSGRFHTRVDGTDIDLRLGELAGVATVNPQNAVYHITATQQPSGLAKFHVSQNDEEAGLRFALAPDETSLASPLVFQGKTCGLALDMDLNLRDPSQITADSIHPLHVDRVADPRLRLVSGQMITADMLSDVELKPLFADSRSLIPIGVAARCGAVERVKANAYGISGQNVNLEVKQEKAGAPVLTDLSIERGMASFRDKLRFDVSKAGIAFADDNAERIDAHIEKLSIDQPGLTAAIISAENDPAIYAYRREDEMHHLSMTPKYVDLTVRGRNFGRMALGPQARLASDFKLDGENIQFNCIDVSSGEQVEGGGYPFVLSGAPTRADDPLSAMALFGQFDIKGTGRFDDVAGALGFNLVGTSSLQGRLAESGSTVAVSQTDFEVQGRFESEHDEILLEPGSHFNVIEGVLTGRSGQPSARLGAGEVVMSDMTHVNLDDLSRSEVHTAIRLAPERHVNDPLSVTLPSGESLRLHAGSPIELQIDHSLVDTRVQAHLGAANRPSKAVVTIPGQVKMNALIDGDSTLEWSRNAAALRLNSLTAVLQGEAGGFKFSSMKVKTTTSPEEPIVVKLGESMGLKEFPTSAQVDISAPMLEAPLDSGSRVALYNAQLQMSRENHQLIVLQRDPLARFEVRSGGDVPMEISTQPKEIRLAVATDPQSGLLIPTQADVDTADSSFHEGTTQIFSPGLLHWSVNPQQVDFRRPVSELLRAHLLSVRSDEQSGGIYFTHEQAGERITAHVNAAAAQKDEQGLRFSWSGLDLHREKNLVAAGTSRQDDIFSTTADGLLRLNPQGGFDVSLKAPLQITSQDGASESATRLVYYGGADIDVRRASATENLRFDLMTTPYGHFTLSDVVTDLKGSTTKITDQVDMRISGLGLSGEVDRESGRVVIGSKANLMSAFGLQPTNVDLAARAGEEDENGLLNFFEPGEWMYDAGRDATLDARVERLRTEDPEFAKRLDRTLRSAYGHEVKGLAYRDFPAAAKIQVLNYLAAVDSQIRLPGKTLGGRILKMNYDTDLALDPAAPSPAVGSSIYFDTYILLQPDAPFATDNGRVSLPKNLVAHVKYESAGYWPGGTPKQGRMEVTFGTLRPRFSNFEDGGISTDSTLIIDEERYPVVMSQDGTDIFSSEPDKNPLLWLLAGGETKIQGFKMTFGPEQEPAVRLAAWRNGILMGDLNHVDMDMVKDRLEKGQGMVAKTFRALTDWNMPAKPVVEAAKSTLGP